MRAAWKMRTQAGVPVGVLSAFLLFPGDVLDNGMECPARQQASVVKKNHPRRESNPDFAGESGAS